MTNYAGTHHVEGRKGPFTFADQCPARINDSERSFTYISIDECIPQCPSCTTESCITPQGAASYYFRSKLVSYVSDQCPNELTIHIGSQPNSSPHLGNITTFTTAFALAQALRTQCARKVSVKLLFVETAPCANAHRIIDGVLYQKSLLHTGSMHNNDTFFTTIMNRLSTLSDVPCEVHTQQFWRDSPHFVPILQSLIDKRHTLAPHLSPETRTLAIRAPCPEPCCGLADKKGINNNYQQKGIIKFMCPHHGAYVVNLRSRDDVKRLGFNTPLRNLIRILICSRDTSRSWIMCTGSDYAGFYQEQLMWRLLETPSKAPLIVYAPQIVDWSGAKLSKSLYVEKGAYQYLRRAGLAYMLQVDTLLSKKGTVEALYEEVSSWISQPFRLFRTYSIEYMHEQLRRRSAVSEREEQNHFDLDTAF